jgi:hypothetical protein
MNMKPWVKKSLIGIGVVIVVLCLAFAFLIREFLKPISPEDIIPPDRAAGIPSDHQWYGGADGGNWIHCTAQDDLREFRCSIYAESGSLLGQGTYVPSRAVMPPYQFRWAGASSINLQDQKGDDLVLLADGWIVDSEGKSLFKRGELVETP